MFRSKLIVPALFVACLLASQAVVPTPAIASPLRANISVQPMFGNKMVNFNLANNTGSSLDIKIGETPMSIEAGKIVKISAAPGTRIIVATACPTHALGSVLAEVSSAISGATIRIN